MCILYDKLYLFARKVCEHLSISVFMVKKMHRCEQRCYAIARIGLGEKLRVSRRHGESTRGGRLPAGWDCYRRHYSDDGDFCFCRGG